VLSSRKEENKVEKRRERSRKKLVGIGKREQGVLPSAMRPHLSSL